MCIARCSQDAQCTAGVHCEWMSAQFTRDEYCDTQLVFGINNGRDVNWGAQHSSGRHRDANVVRPCSIASERHEVQHHGYAGMHVAYGVSGHQPLKVSHLQVWKETPEKFTLYRTRFWSIATKVLNVGLLLGDQLDTLDTFRGKYRYFSEVRLYSSRVTARLRYFRNLVSDVILQWLVSWKLNIFWTALPLKTGRISCPGTSVNNYQLTLHNNGNIVLTLVNRGSRRIFLGPGRF